MSERMMYRLGTIALVLVLVSLLKSCNEIVYMMNGEQTQARLLRVKQIETRTHSRRSRSTREVLEVKYTFEDEHVDRPRTEADRVPLNFEPEISLNEQGNDMVAIEYMPGQKMISRLKGHDSKIWMYIFFGSLGTGAVVAGIACYRFYKS